MQNYKEVLDIEGFAVIPGVYMSYEINKLMNLLNELDPGKPTFRKTKDLFAIRQFLKEVPASDE